MPAGKLIMTSKRLRSRVNNAERRGKRQRIRKRSRSEPLRNDSDNTEKREALKRLFGRICSLEMENNLPRVEEEEQEARFENYEGFGDENDDPLLDSVPSELDPEQLGFLVCAQETLRFLHGRGIPVQHPVFAHLRSRLIRGIGELASA